MNFCEMSKDLIYILSKIVNDATYKLQSLSLLQSSICFIGLLAVTSAQLFVKTRPYATVTQVPFKVRYANVDSAEGRYLHDDSGAYVHDNSGSYVHDDNPYIHEVGADGGSGGAYRDRCEYFEDNNI